MTKNLFHDNSKCMIVIVLSFIIYHLSFSPVSAQTFTQRVQQPAQTGKGSVTIHQSQAIDQLVNNAALGNKVAAKPASSTSTTSKTSATSTTSTTSTPSTAKPVSPSATTDTVGINKPVRGYKATGYRVQAFAGGNSRADRQKAERTGNSIRAQFPNVAVYVHFYSPRWICRVGNYRTYEEAHQMLVSLRNMGYTEATIVKGKISVAY